MYLPMLMVINMFMFYLVTLIFKNLISSKAFIVLLLLLIKSGIYRVSVGRNLPKALNIWEISVALFSNRIWCKIVTSIDLETLPSKLDSITRHPHIYIISIQVYFVYELCLDNFAGPTHIIIFHSFAIDQQL